MRECSPVEQRSEKRAPALHAEHDPQREVQAAKTTLYDCTHLQSTWVRDIIVPENSTIDFATKQQLSSIFLWQAQQYAHW